MAKKKQEYVETNPLSQEVDLQAAHAPALQAEQDLEYIKERLTEDQVTFSEWIGRRKFSQALQKFLTVGDLVELAKLKESKKYKGLLIVGVDGKALTCQTFSDVCEAIGMSEAHVYELLLNLKTFGPEFLTFADGILNIREMRGLRKLPEDHQTALIEAAQRGDKETLVDLAGEFIAKHVKENEALVKRADDAEADLEASRQRVAVKEKETEKLTGEVLKLKRRVETQTPDEAAADIRKEAALFAFRAEHAISGELRPAFQALFDHAEANGGNHSEFMLGLIAQIEREANALRAEFGLLKPKPDGEILPDWMRDDVMEKIKADAEEQKPDWMREQEDKTASSNDTLAG